MKEHFMLGNRQLQAKELRPLCEKLLKIPIYFAEIVLARIASQQPSVNLESFSRFWKEEMKQLTPCERSFRLLDNDQKEYLVAKDFDPLMNAILELHPGLDFLKPTPEFQEKYAVTVVQRILFELDWDDDGKIYYRDYKHSKFFSTLERLEKEEEINSIRDFFIYEHFYVIYCRFYELDSDHDEFISKEDFSKYNRHALSERTIDRIWEQSVRKFTSKKPNFMNYNDFTFFLLVEEDKTHFRSINYWFRIIDIDCNGLLT